MDMDDEKRKIESGRLSVFMYALRRAILGALQARNVFVHLRLFLNVSPDVIVHECFGQTCRCMNAFASS